MAGVAVPKPATLVRAGDEVRLDSPGHEWASRGGRKLDAALDVFGIEAVGRRALDVGASTGGFTDVLLSRGVASVAAVDVGYGQLVWRLRTDPRVTVFDRTNFRTADLAGLGAPFDLIVMDVSFISIGLLSAPLAAAGTAESDYVLLVKPQFEVGRDAVGRGGIVTSAARHHDAVVGSIEALSEHGLRARDVCRSPIEGAKGNIEFFVHAVAGGGPGIGPDAVAEVTGR